MQIFGLLVVVLLLVLNNAGSVQAKKSKNKEVWSTDEKNEFINAFNKYRSDVSNPPASYMTSMLWDTYIEKQAQAIADKCECAHSKSSERLYIDGEEMGEHIWAGDWTPPPTHVVDRWAGTKGNYTYSNSDYNHYTQIIWNGTYRVGCGKKRCGHLTGTKWSPGTLVVCNYYPRGNIAGMYPYVGLATGAPAADTCATHGTECGTMRNNQSATVACNSCYGNEMCSWDNKCLCIPKTCKEFGYDCGDIDDGCGTKNYTCGKCGGDSECRSNKCFVFERYRTVLLFFNYTYITNQKEPLNAQLEKLIGADNIVNITYTTSPDFKIFEMHILIADVSTAHRVYDTIKKNENIEEPLSQRNRVELMDVYYSGEIKIGFGGAIGLVLVVAYIVALCVGIGFIIRRDKAKQKSDEVKQKLDKLDEDL